jgi:hypothetical protein
MLYAPSGSYQKVIGGRSADPRGFALAGSSKQRTTTVHTSSPYRINKFRQRRTPDGAYELTTPIKNAK